MKEYNPDAIRNIALVGHGGSGKTTISEYLLYSAGEINRIGTIEEGNTTSDFNPNEIERQISITSTPLHIEWKDHKINLLDTPGYSDFIGQVISSLHVADTAVSVIKAAEGVEVGTESTWEYIKDLDIPSAIIINKIDNEHSKFDETVQMAKDRLSQDVTVISFPVKEGQSCEAVVDLVRMKLLTNTDPKNKNIQESEIPADVKAKADNLREELIEKIAESSEELMDKYFEEGTLNEEDFQKGMKEAINSGNLIPAFAASSEKGIGLGDFLDFSTKYFSSPAERGKVKATKADSEEEVELSYDTNGSLALQIFKSLSEQHVGELSIFKVFNGKLTTGVDLINPANSTTERIGQLYMLNGKHRKEVSSLEAGDVGAVVKLKDTHTGDTLCAKNDRVMLPKIKFPDSVIRAAIQPKAKGDEDKISSGLHIIHEEDSTLKVNYDPEIAQSIIAGQGELQLSMAVKMLKDRYGVEVALVEPRIPYRETIKGTCDNSEYKHKKQSGGRGQFGHVYLKIEPQPRGEGFEFVNAIVGGVVPSRFVPAVEKGIKEVMDSGILTGSKVVDIKVTLFDGNYHPVDSDEVSFKIAGAQAFKRGFMDAKPVILEPIYDIVIKVPEEFMGDVMGDVSSRRGKISGMESEGPFQIIKAKVPLAELYKYSTHLRSLTSGRGMHNRSFSHYEEVPKEIEQKIIEEYKKSKEEA